jgi:hypothetical protein
MKYLLLIVAVSLTTACTTVNVYNDSEPVIVIQKTPMSPRNPDNPYDRRRSY